MKVNGTLPKETKDSGMVRIGMASGPAKVLYGDTK